MLYRKSFLFFIRYNLCSSYPQSLVVPCTVPDEVLNQVGLYRSKGRIPALSYFHRRRGTAITRCAQPLAGPEHSHRCLSFSLVCNLTAFDQDLLVSPATQTSS